MAPYLEERFLPPASSQVYYPRIDASNATSASWTGKDLSEGGAYTYVLTHLDIQELEDALVYCNDAGLGPNEVSQSNFPLPRLGKTLENLALELHEGKGFFVLHGLNPDNYSIEDNTTIFLGVSSYIGGILGRQTDDGHLFGHVCNPNNLSVAQESRPLKYSNRASTFHNDLYCDIIALQSRRCAQDGGNHLLVSAARVYSELQRTKPELAAALFMSDWPLDLRRRISPTETRPLFFRRNDHLISSVIPDALTGSPDIKRQSGVPNLSPIQIKAHNTLQSLCRKHCLSLPLLKGDLVYVNNFALLHAREAFQDSEVHNRYLVRLWLKNKSMAWELPEVLRRGNDAVFRDESGEKVWNIVPEPEFRFRVYERQSP